MVFAGAYPSIEYPEDPMASFTQFIKLLIMMLIAFKKNYFPP